MSDKFSDIFGKALEKDTTILEKHYTELTTRVKSEIKSSIEEAFDVSSVEYIPFFISDLYANLFSQYGEWLSRDWSRVGAEFGERTAKELRQKIFQDNKEIIIKELNQDNLEKIEQLKKDLEQERSYRFNNF